MCKLFLLAVFMLCSVILLSNEYNVREIQVKLYDDFGLVDDLHTKTLCSFTNNKIFFEIVTGVPQKISVGSYLLTIQKDGYEDISEQIIITPGNDIFTIEHDLTTLPREVILIMHNDCANDSTDDYIRYISPDVVTLNGKTLINGSKIKPGEYEFIMEKDGCEKVCKKILITPGSSTYRLFEQMKRLDRLVYFKITSDYNPEKEIVPDDIMVNNHFVKIRRTNYNYIHPETCRITIKKRGYKTFSERIKIYPSSKTLFLELKLQVLPRSVRANIYASSLNIHLSPDLCTLNGINIKDQEMFKPGNYQLHVEQSGYISIDKEIEIPPSDIPFIISETLQSK